MSKTLDEIFQHYFFINSVNDQIGKAREFRRKIVNEAIISPTRSNSIRLKSDAFSSLEKRCQINPINLAAEYKLIYEKRSELPSREREWISKFVGDIIFQAIVYFDKLEKSELSKITQECDDVPKVKKSRKIKTK